MSAVAGLVAGCSACRSPSPRSAPPTRTPPLPNLTAVHYDSDLVTATTVLAFEHRGCYRAPPLSDGWAILDAALPDIAPFTSAIRLLGRTPCSGLQRYGFRCRRQ